MTTNRKQRECCEKCYREYPVAEVYVSDITKGWYCMDLNCQCHTEADTSWKEQIPTICGQILRSSNESERPVSRQDARELLEYFIESLLTEERERVVREIEIKIEQYKDYFNPINDELNKGKHLALNALKEELNKLKGK